MLIRLFLAQIVTVVISFFFIVYARIACPSLSQTVYVFIFHFKSAKSGVLVCEPKLVRNFLRQYLDQLC